MCLIRLRLIRNHLNRYSSWFVLRPAAAFIVLHALGCQETTPVDPSPLPNPDTTTIPIAEAEPVPVPAKVALSVDQELDRLAEFVQQQWGDGDGFLPAPDQADQLPEIDVVELNLRWNQIDSKLKEKAKERFSIDKNARCVFTGRGAFFSNNHLYPAVLFRASNRQEGVILSVEQNSQQVSRPVRAMNPILLTEESKLNAKAVREKLQGLSLPNGMIVNELPEEECGFSTSWTALRSVEGASSNFEWRLLLSIHDAVGQTETELYVIDSVNEGRTNRLDLLSTIQFRDSEANEILAQGLALVTPLGFDGDTNVYGINRVYTPQIREFSLASVSEADLEKPVEAISTISFLRQSSLNGTIREIHDAVTSQLTVDP